MVSVGASQSVTPGIALDDVIAPTLATRMGPDHNADYRNRRRSSRLWALGRTATDGRRKEKGMNKMLIAAFDNETAAFEGLKALKDLHESGDISLYSWAVIARDRAGKIQVKDQVDPGPVGTALGMLTGSIVGLLAGPVGAAIGASVGGLSGLLFDLDKADVGVAFFNDVAKMLTPGKTAVLADVDETWTTPVDTRMREHGGTVSRRFRAEVAEDHLVRESAAFEANLKALEDEINQANAENRIAVQKEIDEAKKTLKATQEQAKARLDQVRAEMEAKIRTLQAQAKGAGVRAKARIDKRMAAARADYDMRSKKLNQAWQLTKQALAA